MYRILYKNLPITSVFSALFLVSCVHQTEVKKEVSLEALGNAAYEKKQYNTAQTYFKQAIQTTPTVEAYSGLAQSLEAMGNWQDAAKIWGAIINIETITPSQGNDFRLNAAKNHARLGESLRAQEFLSQIDDKKVLMSREGLLVSGLVSVLEGNEEEAIAAFNDILQENSEDQSAKNNLALTYLVFDQPYTAIKLLNEIADVESVSINKAISMVLLGQKEQAYDLLKESHGQETTTQIIKFAENLSYLPSTARARYLFGIE